MASWNKQQKGKQQTASRSWSVNYLSLDVTMTEAMTGATAEKWREFCNALIDETRELLSERNDERREERADRAPVE